MGSQFSRVERLSWAVFVASLAQVGVAIALSFAGRSLSLTPVVFGAVLLAALGLLVAIRHRLARRQEVEAYNLEVYREEHPGTELFEDSDEALKLASRAFKAYDKVAAPVLAAVVGGVGLLAGVLLWRQWSSLAALPTIREAARYGILAAVLFVANVLAGSFYVGASREAGCRWLRVCGAWLFLVGGLWLLAALSLFVDASTLAWPRFDMRVGFVGLAALLVLSGELIVGVIIEFYRPHRAHEEERPIYESRLLALITEPGGIARNVATSLDYQFGFKISEGAFYRFLERSLLPLVLLLVAVFWLSSALVVIDAEQNGIRERFGRVVSEEPLSPGIYAKLPWPFGRIYTYPVQRVQNLAIGYQEHGDDEMPGPEVSPELVGDLTGRVIVWAKKHNREEINFVVASHPDEGEAILVDDSGQDRVPVSSYFLAVSMPLFFTVDNLYDYAYRHASSKDLLEKIAHEELAKYCAQVDFFDLLTSGREAAGEAISRSIQARADGLRLGVDVVFLGLHGVHPPVTVGASFNEVVSASEEKHTMVLEAETVAVSVRAKAEGDAASLLAEAHSYTYDRRQVAQAEAERFGKQLQAYLASPELFPLRSFLTVLEEQGANLRKYIVAVREGREVVIFNLEEKLGQDLLDINLEREN